MMKKFKPLLLSNEEFNLEELDYTNMYISIKRDGVRAEITNEGIKGRSFKEFKNNKLNEYFEEFINLIDDYFEEEIFEGEIYCDGIPCREMAGICNSKDKDIPKGTKLYLFGVVDLELPFGARIKKLSFIQDTDKVEKVEQNKVETHIHAAFIYAEFLEEGFEGAVLMDGSKKYKCGRVTIKEHIGFKLKPHKEEDLEIIGVTERLHNTNESQTNELGHSFKRNTVADKESTGIAATFVCLMPNGKTETKVSIIGDETFRREIWENQKDYIGKYAVVKSMDYGAKDKLRHPRLSSIKEKCEK